MPRKTSSCHKTCDLTGVVDVPIAVGVDRLHDILQHTVRIFEGCEVIAAGAAGPCQLDSEGDDQVTRDSNMTQNLR